MAKLITYIYDKTKFYYKYVIIAFLIILFLGVSTYVYKAMFKPKQDLKAFDDVANTVDRKSSIQIFMFFVDWCPHCKTAKPEWDAFKRQFNGTVVNGSVVKCYAINCTDDNGADVTEIDNSDPTSPVETGISQTSVRTSELIRKYNIDSYPTIKLQKGDTTVEFDAKITHVSLSKFVNSV